MLMGIFILGNLLCAVAANYGLLMLARIITALCHGAFFGIGSVVAASLVPANRKASAVALMFTGLTLAKCSAYRPAPRWARSPAGARRSGR
jgi:Arabinose efflux permease